VNRTDADLRAAHAVENKEVLDFENVKFVLDLHYSGRIDAPPQPVWPSQVEELLRDFVSRVRAKDENLQPPSAARQQEIRNAIVRMRVPNFLLAAGEYIRQGQWQREDGTIVGDGWSAIAGLEISYLPEARARAARLAAQEKREREERQKAEEEAKVWRRERLWNDYLLALSTPDWPGMPDADCELKESVAVEGEELGQQSIGVVRRYKLHRRDELVAAKQELRDKLAQCAKWALAYDDKGRSEYAATIKALSEWIDRVQDIESLRSDEYAVDNLYADLDPDRPERSIDDF
jgi:hypothetical protein